LKNRISSNGLGTQRIEEQDFFQRIGYTADYGYKTSEERCSQSDCDRVNRKRFFSEVRKDADVLAEVLQVTAEGRSLSGGHSVI